MTYTSLTPASIATQLRRHHSEKRLMAAAADELDRWQLVEELVKRNKALWPAEANHTHIQDLVYHLLSLHFHTERGH